MRIIAGKYRNRIIKVGKSYRPTTDRARESLFNILQNEVEGSHFVDAFAGSGAVGMEALSRGVASVSFVENNPRALFVLEENLSTICKEDSWKIYAVSVWKSLELIRAEQPVVHFIFYDPPYDFHAYTKLLEYGIAVFPGATHVLEISTRTNFELPFRIRETRNRKIGETLLTFYQSVDDP